MLTAMKLYNYFRSSASYRVRIALAIKNLPYDYVPVHLLKGDHKKPEFGALSADGFVPLLEDAGEHLSQSMAIMEYLDEVHPSPPLLPSDPVGRAKVRALAQSVACDIHPLNNLRVLNRLRSRHGADDAVVAEWVQHWIGEGFTALEALARLHSKDGRHSFGDGVTVVDICLVPQMYNARRFGCDLAPFPTLVAIDAHCRSLAAFRSAEPELQPDAAV